MSIIQELQKALKTKSTDYVKLAEGANSSSDDVWRALSEEAQIWSNKVLEEDQKAKRDNREPDFPDPEGRVKSEKKQAEKQASPAKAKTPSVKEKAPKQPKQKATPRGINVGATEPKACREGTKQAVLVDLLSRKEGATFAELHAAMNGPDFKHLKPWAEVTTRSALSWDVHAVKGYGVRTEFKTVEALKADGRKASGAKDALVAVYHLVLPKGMKAPLPHTPRKTVEPKAPAAKPGKAKKKAEAKQAA